VSPGLERSLLRRSSLRARLAGRRLGREEDYLNLFDRSSE
jgi:hypothetical protein